MSNVPPFQEGIRQVKTAPNKPPGGSKKRKFKPKNGNRSYSRVSQSNNGNNYESVDTCNNRGLLSLDNYKQRVNSSGKPLQEGEREAETNDAEEHLFTGDDLDMLLLAESLVSADGSTNGQTVSSFKRITKKPPRLPTEDGECPELMISGEERPRSVKTEDEIEMPLLEEDNDVVTDMIDGEVSYSISHRKKTNGGTRKPKTEPEDHVQPIKNDEWSISFSSPLWRKFKASGRKNTQQHKPKHMSTELVKIVEDPDPNLTRKLKEVILRVYHEFKLPFSHEYLLHHGKGLDKDVVDSINDRIKLSKTKLTPPMGKLTLNQYIAMCAVLRGCNVFVTGVAGSGKSHFLRYIYTFITTKLNLPVVVTASTGTSASNLAIPGAITLHSFIGRETFSGTPEEEFRNAFEMNPNSKRLETIRQTSILILDEVSLISAEFLDKIDKYFRLVRGVDIPFGGIQIILTGDLMQLPPVVKQKTEGEPGDHDELSNTILRGRNVQQTYNQYGNISGFRNSTGYQENDDEIAKAFCLNAYAWNEIKNVIYFTDNLRQRECPELFKILQEMRKNALTEDSLQKLLSRVVDFESEHQTAGNRGRKRHYTKKDTCKDTGELTQQQKPTVGGEKGPDPVHIYPRKFQVNRVNAKTLRDLKSQGKESHNFAKRTMPIRLREEEVKYYFKKALRDLSSIEDNLELCTNMPVILTVNYDNELRNGSRGVIVGWYDPEEDPARSSLPEVNERGVQKKNTMLPIVEFILPNGVRITEVIRYWIWDIPKDPMYTFRTAVLRNQRENPYSGYLVSNIPLTCSSAITIHRAQCQTFTSIRVMLTKEIFQKNMSYVALSRSTSLAGIQIQDPLDMKTLTVFDEIKEYYEILERKTAQKLTLLKNLADQAGIGDKFQFNIPDIPLTEESDDDEESNPIPPPSNPKQYSVTTNLSTKDDLEDGDDISPLKKKMRKSLLDMIEQ